MRSARRTTSTYVDWPMPVEQAKLEEPPLRVDSIMSKHVFSCHAGDTLNVPAQIMWDHDCGCVPVVDELGRVVAMITDRDVCMAAYTQTKPLHQISVSSACSRRVYTCHMSELVSEAARIMERAQVRRLPIVDSDDTLVGLLTLSDLARNAQFARFPSAGALSAERVAGLLQVVSLPRVGHAQTSALVPMAASEKERLASFDAL